MPYVYQLKNCSLALDHLNAFKVLIQYLFFFLFSFLFHCMVHNRLPTSAKVCPNRLFVPLHPCFMNIHYSHLWRWLTCRHLCCSSIHPHMALAQCLWHWHPVQEWGPDRNSSSPHPVCTCGTCSALCQMGWWLFSMRLSDSPQGHGNGEAAWPPRTQSRSQQGPWRYRWGWGEWRWW